MDLMLVCKLRLERHKKVAQSNNSELHGTRRCVCVWGGGGGGGWKWYIIVFVICIYTLGFSISRCISPVSMTGHERGVDHEYSASDSDQEKVPSGQILLQNIYYT